MRQLLATLENISPYSQSRFIASEKGPKENHDAFEARTWRERIHTNDDGEVIVPVMALKYSTDEAAKRLAIRVPGEGKTLYTKYFEAGYFVAEPPNLGIRADAVKGEWLWMSSNGKKGKDAGPRVRRCYPIMPQWKTEVKFIVLDDKIPEEIFERCLESAGWFVGIGRFRPEKQGYFGRFKIADLKWSEM
jgi:hypothetical protein